MLRDELVEFSFGLHYNFVKWLEAREIEMVDQLARLLANNVSYNAEIQNLNIKVLERVEVYLFLDFMPTWRWLWSFLLLISALCREIFCYFSLIIIPYCSFDRYRGSSAADWPATSKKWRI